VTHVTHLPAHWIGLGKTVVFQLIVFRTCGSVYFIAYSSREYSADRSSHRPPRRDVISYMYTTSNAAAEAVFFSLAQPEDALIGRDEVLLQCSTYFTKTYSFNLDERHQNGMKEQTRTKTFLGLRVRLEGIGLGCNRLETNLQALGASTVVVHAKYCSAGLDLPNVAGALICVTIGTRHGSAFILVHATLVCTLSYTYTSL
jgi:hypothetical protein